MRKEKHRIPRDPALSTRPSDTNDSSQGTDEIGLDRLLVGDKSIWAALFDGEFKLAVRCDCCGRWLTAGASKRNGRGPVCSARAVKQ